MTRFLEIFYYKSNFVLINMYMSEKENMCQGIKKGQVNNLSEISF